MNIEDLILLNIRKSRSYNGSIQKHFLKGYRIFSQGSQATIDSWVSHFKTAGNILCPVLAVFFLFFVPSSLAQAQDENTALTLTASQMEWLSEHPVIRIGPDPFFPPIEWVDDKGNYRGIAADFLRLLQEKIGISCKVIPAKSWDEVPEQAKSGQVDLLPAAAKTPDRSQYLLYSEPHLTFSGVIITRAKVGKDISLKELSSMRVSVVRGYIWQELLEHDFPSAPWPGTDPWCWERRKHSRNPSQYPLT